MTSLISAGYSPTSHNVHFMMLCCFELSKRLANRSEIIVAEKRVTERETAQHAKGFLKDKGPCGYSG